MSSHGLAEAFSSRPATMKAKTVNRLRAGIAALKASGDSITAKTLERETGLSYQTIRRNEEAYKLYCEHADYFRTQVRAVRGAKLARGEASAHRGRRTRRVPSARPRDPLFAYTKQKLVDRSRALEQRIALLERLLAKRGAREQQLETENIRLRARLVQTGEDAGVTNGERS